MPVLNAMLICDTIINESNTNKKSLIGVFENIYAHSFPCRHYSLSVYVKFTDAQGKYNFRLELVDLESNQILGKGIIGEQDIADKLASYELVFNLMGLEFKHPGKYEFRIFANDYLFGHKSLNILVAK